MSFHTIRQAPARLNRSELAVPGSHWLRIVLEGGGSNSSAIGARIALVLSERGSAAENHEEERPHPDRFSRES